MKEDFKVMDFVVPDDVLSELRENLGPCSTQMLTEAIAIAWCQGCKWCRLCDTDNETLIMLPVRQPVVGAWESEIDFVPAECEPTRVCGLWVEQIEGGRPSVNTQRVETWTVEDIEAALRFIGDGEDGEHKGGNRS